MKNLQKPKKNSDFLIKKFLIDLVIKRVNIFHKYAVINQQTLMLNFLWFLTDFLVVRYTLIKDHDRISFSIMTKIWVITRVVLVVGF